MLTLGTTAPALAQATDVVCTGCVASTDIADASVAGADLATSAVSSVKIADGAIVNADISATAAIAGTKVAPNFGTQNVVTTGTIYAGKFIDNYAVAGAYYTLDPSSATIAGTFNGSVGIGTLSPSSRLDVNGALSVRGMSAPAAAPAGQGRLYYDSTANKFKVSQNGAAYVDLLGGGGISQWAASGTNISYTTGNVGIGTDQSGGDYSE